MKKIELTKKQLNKIVRKIDRDANLKRLYSSKFHKIVNFLYHNTGLKIAKVSEGGSGAKLTYTQNSDIDIIFATAEDYNKDEMLEYLKEKANKLFGEVANIRTSSNALQIDFVDPPCDIDLVYKTKHAFDQEFREIKQIKTLKGIQQNAIKIVKYAFDNLVGEAIHGYEVEIVCLQFTHSRISDLVYAIIHYFKGRLRDNGITPQQVITYLAKQ